MAPRTIPLKVLKIVPHILQLKLTIYFVRIIDVTRGRGLSPRARAYCYCTGLDRFASLCCRSVIIRSHGPWQSRTRTYSESAAAAATAASISQSQQLHCVALSFDQITLFTWKYKCQRTTKKCSGDISRAGGTCHRTCDSTLREHRNCVVNCENCIVKLHAQSNTENVL